MYASSYRGRAFRIYFHDKVTVIHTYPIIHSAISPSNYRKHIACIACRGLQEPAESRGKYILRASEECFWNGDVNHLGWDRLCQTTHHLFQQRAALKDNGRKAYQCLLRACWENRKRKGRFHRFCMLLGCLTAHLLCVYYMLGSISNLHQPQKWRLSRIF